MKAKARIVSLLFCVVLLGAPAIYAQGGVKTGPDPSTIRDPDLERDSLHNLEVARNYFKLKKAYVAALSRLEEIIAGNPNFAKIEEVYLMAGQASVWLADGKGKQKSDRSKLTAEQLRQQGREYLSKLVNDYPDGQFTREAAEELKAVGGPLPKTAGP